VGESDRERWDLRHAAVGPAAPAPPDALGGLLDAVPTAGRALDVAAGRGAVAVWLAQRGLAVDAVDVSGSALAATAALAGEHGVAHRVAEWPHDLDAGLPAGCAGPYDVVVCQRFREPALYPALVARLAPRGLLVVTVLSEVDATAGPFRAPAGELRAVFGGLEVLDDREGGGEAHLVARRR
jgi:2-polyprenyl-3-methyl-5-hydroxy-6-metoxy-1,4-benzoquinol methylase